jgi:glycosyltransferase involved in cell wall biosynthesis
MLRVAYVFERFPSFGQTFCYREVAALERQGADVTVFSIRRPTGGRSEKWDPNIVERVHYLPDEAPLVKEIDRAARKRELPVEAAREIAAWGRQSDFLRLYQAAYIGMRLRQSGVDRVHAHFAGMAARTAYWLRQFFGIRYSITAHANDIFAPREFEISLAKIFDAAAAIVSVSDFAVARLRQQFPSAAAKTHRVYNGVEVAAFPRAHFASATPRIVSVGRLIEKKGFSDLIRACALLKEKPCEFRCEIIGEGPLADALSAQISASQLDGRVALLGARTQREIAENLKAATLFVLPCTSDREGGMDNLPTVIMEAMAAGLPVISTAIAGVPEMVQPGITGALVPPNDPVALANAIEQVIRDRARAAEYGECAHALAIERFSIEANVRALTQILAST